jgi:hypothetical protein
MVDGMNLYRYALNHPLGRIDPGGKQSKGAEPSTDQCQKIDPVPSTMRPAFYDKASKDVQDKIDRGDPYIETFDPEVLESLQKGAGQLSLAEQKKLTAKLCDPSVTAWRKYVGGGSTPSSQPASAPASQSAGGSPSSQPATMPSSQPASAPSSQPGSAPSSQPAEEHHSPNFYKYGVKAIRALYEFMEIFQHHFPKWESVGRLTVTPNSVWTTISKMPVIISQKAPRAVFSKIAARALFWGYVGSRGATAGYKIFFEPGVSTEEKINEGADAVIDILFAAAAFGGPIGLGISLTYWIADDFVLEKGAWGSLRDWLKF